MWTENRIYIDNNRNLRYRRQHFWISNETRERMIFFPSSVTSRAPRELTLWPNDLSNNQPVTVNNICSSTNSFAVFVFITILLIDIILYTYYIYEVCLKLYVLNCLLYIYFFFNDQFLWLLIIFFARYNAK